MKLLNNYWYIVLESRELKVNKPIKVKRFAQNIALWRNPKGKIFALDDRCPHRGASLSQGFIKDDCLSCPFHGIRFDGSGTCQEVPYFDEVSVKLKLRVKSFKVTEKYGFVWLWNGDQEPQVEPSIFGELDRGYAYHTTRKEWNTHYSRAIENQLDYYHLPFVHSKTIGRGFSPASGEDVSKRLKVDFEGEQIKANMKNESNNKNTSFKFLFPNSWLLNLSPFLFLYVAFVPIDEENTRLYLRTYLKGKSLRSVKRFILKASPVFNKRILEEDESVVLSQTPKEIHPDMKEHLLVLDKPIAFFRTHYFDKLVPGAIESNQID